MTVPDDVRARFEASMRELWGDDFRPERHPRAPDEYLKSFEQMAWVGYRAAHADLSGEARDGARWRAARNNTGDGLRLIRWNSKAPEELQVMFPSPALCDLDADDALARFTQEKP